MNIEWIREMINQYLPNLSREDIQSLNEWITSNDGMCKDNFLINWYLDEIKDHIDNLSKLSIDGECIFTSGFICFIGQLILYMCQYGLWNSSAVRDIRDFTLLYLYTDYCLDNHPSDDIMNILGVMIRDPYKFDSITGLDPIVKLYRGILERHKNCKDKMINVMVSELEGISYQKRNDLGWDDYLSIAIKKGSSTTIAIQSMFTENSSLNDQVGNLGVIIQFIDDMLDVELDKKNNINTIATYSIDVLGSMDKLWIETARRIHEIHEPFVVFKTLMLEALMYVLSIYKSFSQWLRDVCKDYIHIDYNKGSHMMEILSKTFRLRM